MKKYILALLCTTLTACGGGSGGGSGGGADGAPGKSAYQIWLDNGHSGSEQDFLDSLVSSGGSGYSNTIHNYKNLKESLDAEIAGEHSVGQHPGLQYTMTNKSWASQGGYKQYVVTYYSGLSAFASYPYDTKVITTYNEKELNLVNYGVYKHNYEIEYMNYESRSQVPGGYTHNRNGFRENIYVPSDGTVFNGGTLAYLYNSGKSTVAEQNPVLIKGSATFTYNPNTPTLVLNFENYYNITMNQTDTTTRNISVSGTNSTGYSEYNLPTGVFSQKAPIPNENNDFLKRGSTEEVAGIYTIDATKANFNNSSIITNPFNITGSFGATKQ